MLKTRKRQAQPAPTAKDVHDAVAEKYRGLTERVAGIQAALAIDGLKSRKERESDRFATDCDEEPVNRPGAHQMHGAPSPSHPGGLRAHPYKRKWSRTAQCVEERSEISELAVFKR